MGDPNSSTVSTNRYLALSRCKAFKEVNQSKGFLRAVRGRGIRRTRYGDSRLDTIDALCEGDRIVGILNRGA